MKKTKKMSPAKQLFFKSMIYTAAAIALLVIGYFSAQFFFTQF